MNIKGLQKTTLLDYPGRVACTVFTGGCNFRCPFCHNAGLVLDPASEPSIDEDEFFSFLNKRRGVLDGVCITGGEPLLQVDIEGFIERIKNMGFLVKLDTNGAFPEKLEKLIHRKLIDYVAMDIKAPLYGYAEAVGVKGFDVSPIQKSVDIIINAHIDYEFRTTAVKGLIEEADFVEIGKWLKGAKRYFIQAFRDSETIIASLCGGFELSEFTPEELRTFGDSARPYFGSVEVRGV